MSGTVALVVGAGEGLRFGGEVPKQYRRLAGHAILRRSLMAFLDHPEVTAVQAVIHPNHQDLYQDAVRGLSLPSPVHGGATRQESVALGLESLADNPPARVLVHDPSRVSAEELPDDIWDLTDPKWRGKILVRSSENIYNQSLLASMIAVHGDEAAERWADAMLECAPLSLRVSKQMALQGLDSPFEVAHSRSYSEQQRQAASADRIEGPRAFAEKRTPNWTGA